MLMTETCPPACCRQETEGYATPSDISPETDSGRGPVDYKISRGSDDITLVEFKIAKSSSLKRNLQKQVEIYKKANNTENAFIIIIYFNNDEFVRTMKILKELNLDNNENIILIDSGLKTSASKA
jgi:hypothetical protein